jgi:hypothetical protein
MTNAETPLQHQLKLALAQEYLRVGRTAEARAALPTGYGLDPTSQTILQRRSGSASGTPSNLSVNGRAIPRAPLQATGTPASPAVPSTLPPLNMQVEATGTSSSTAAPNPGATSGSDPLATLRLYGITPTQDQQDYVNGTGYWASSAFTSLPPDQQAAQESAAAQSLMPTMQQRLAIMGSAPTSGDQNAVAAWLMKDPSIAAQVQKNPQANVFQVAGGMGIIPPGYKVGGNGLMQDNAGRNALIIGASIIGGGIAYGALAGSAGGATAATAPVLEGTAAGPGATTLAAGGTAAAAGSDAAAGGTLAATSTVPSLGTLPAVAASGAVPAAFAGTAGSTLAGLTAAQWTRLIGGGASAIGGFIPKTTSSTSSTTLPPGAQSLQDLVNAQITQRLQNNSLPPGYQEQGIAGINAGYAGATTNENAALTARGLASSPVAAAVTTKLNTARAGDIGTFNANIPLVAQNLQLQNLEAAAGILNPQRGSTSTTSGDGGAAGAATNLASYLSYVYGPRAPTSAVASVSPASSSSAVPSPLGTASYAATDPTYGATTPAQLMALYSPYGPFTGAPGSTPGSPGVGY